MELSTHGRESSETGSPPSPHKLGFAKAENLSALTDVHHIDRHTKIRILGATAQEKDEEENWDRDTEKPQKDVAHCASFFKT